MIRLQAVLLLLCLPRTLGAAVTIDDFSAGPLDVTLTPSSPSSTLVQTGLPTASVIGGNRKHHAILNGPTLPGTEARIVTDTSVETYRLTSTADIEATRLDYGLGPASEPGPALDLDLSAFNAFRFDVISSVESGVTSITLRSGLNEDTPMGVTSDRFTFPASATPYSQMILFSSFFDLVDFSDIDFIRVQGGGAAGLDYILDGIFVVPEPATLALTLLGIIALFLTRPRN